MTGEHRNQWTQTPFLEIHVWTLRRRRIPFLNTKAQNPILKHQEIIKEMSHSEQRNAEIIYGLVWNNIKKLSWVPQSVTNQWKWSSAAEQNPLAFMQQEAHNHKSVSAPGHVAEENLPTSTDTALTDFFCDTRKWLTSAIQSFKVREKCSIYKSISEEIWEYHTTQSDSKWFP